MRAKTSNISFIPPQINNTHNSIQYDEFKEICNIILDLTGIKLSDSKLTMVESRLSKRLRQNSLSCFNEYINLIKHDEKEFQNFINALTTNKTEFFREINHFNLLTNQYLPQIIKNSSKQQVRIWSAASSTGEEAYTIAMILKEFFSSLNQTWDYKILGTDIDTDVLKEAQNGIYKDDVISEIRPELIHKYFLRGKQKFDGYYKVSNEIKSLVKFRQFNLIKDEFSYDIKFDIIFLRNVLIYFNIETIQLVIDKMYKQLNPGGFLFIGHSETLNGIRHRFKPVHSSTYQKI